MPKIFKAGNYGAKGNYTVENLKSWIGKEFSITAGHIGDWQKNGYPITAIPIAGSCKVTNVDENGYLIGEFNYNSFGESIKEQYPNLSIGIGNNGEPNHLALLGYAPPHLKDLDKSFSEFSQDLTSLETTQTIEFAEDEQSKIDEFVNFIRDVDASKIKLGNLFDALWDKDSEKSAVDKLRNAGYTVEKTTEFSKEILGSIANNLGYILAEKTVENLTQAEIYEKVRAEFARDTEKKEVKDKIMKMFPPVMHNIIEFAINKAFDEKEYSNIIEFSEEEKGTMANKLKEFSKGDGPFKHLFENYINNNDFSKQEYDPIKDAKETAELGGY
ncbi:hypothetical protein [Fusobacterium sp. SYSU M8D902]|uniref:hypothetical protein n=1 Tax=Fusobacterium sp. SYSU M8D902 TaxID=3159562 RepID=UPI0032E4757A